MGRSQVVRHRILIPVYGGSNPPAPASLIDCIAEPLPSRDYCEGARYRNDFARALFFMVDRPEAAGVSREIRGKRTGGRRESPNHAFVEKLTKEKGK